MHKLKGIKLITFDVTKTILKFKKPVGQQYADVAALYGISADGNALTNSFKDNFAEMLADKPNFGLKGEGWQKWWSELVAKTFASVGKADKKKLPIIASHLIKLYSTEACWELDKDTLAILTVLKNRKFKLGVISNYDPRLTDVLTAVAVGHYFDFVTVSYVAGFSKPDRRIFNCALDEGGCAAREALHVGNDLNLDYLAAKHAGWNALLIKNKPLTNEELLLVDENDVIKSLMEVDNKIGNENDIL